jgi:hypothetical protein
MATLAVYEAHPDFLSLDGSNNVLTWFDQTVNAYDLSEGSSTNGGVFSTGSFGGYGSILQDGTDDYLFTSSGLANAAVGGTDNSVWIGLAQQYVSTGAGGDCCFSFGNSASNNFFWRYVEGTAAVTEIRKRDDATAAGAGDGGTSTAWNTTRQYWEVSHNGTAVDLNRQAPNLAMAAYLTGTSLNVGACTANRFAIGTLLRTGVGGFMNQRVAAMHILDAPPTTTDRDLLRSWFSRYITPPMAMGGRHRIRTDRHLHRPTSWKLSRHGVMVPAEPKVLVQVHGLKPAEPDGGVYQGVNMAAQTPEGEAAAAVQLTGFEVAA